MKYNTLGFTLHRKCNAECAMCCFKSNPRSVETLNIDRIKEYIDEASEIGDITTIAFTGGEPFLTYNNLIELVSYATQKGKRATCVTNGFWATTHEKTFDLLTKLKTAGLKHISVSHDAYHKEYVPTKNIKTLLQVCTLINLPSTVAMVKIKDEKIGTMIDNLEDSIYSSNLQIVPCLPTGGARNAFLPDADRTLPAEHLRCIYSGNLVIAYDGNIYPCCSQVITEVGLSVGSFYEISLKEALLKIKNNALLYFLRNKEMDFFTDYLKNEGQAFPEYVVNPCELCAYIFKKENLKLLYPYVKRKISDQKKAIPNA